jgi:hypothetical protein
VTKVPQKCLLNSNYLKGYLSRSREIQISQAFCTSRAISMVHIAIFVCEVQK